MIAQTKEERWHFTKLQANAMYKEAHVNAKRNIPGVPKEYMKQKVNGVWFYRVNYLNPGEQRNYNRDLWGQYGYLTYYSNKRGNDSGFYVRRN
jgi:hypothetical protein